MPYLLLAEHNFQDQELKPLRNLVAALFRLEISQEPAHLASVVENLLEWLKDSKQASLRRAFTVWFHRVLFADKPAPERLGPLNELGEVQVMLAERVQEWKKEWKKEAISEGTAIMLRQLLEHKFGSLEERIVGQLQTADDQQLQEWGKRILTATTLNEIFDN
jgi:hypothetical protein